MKVVLHNISLAWPCQAVNSIDCCVSWWYCARKNTLLHNSSKSGI